MAQPILDGVTLAYPTTYSIDEILQGSVMEMASGLHVVDIVEEGLLGNNRTVYKLSWKLITSSELADIRTAYWGLITDGLANFVDIDGTPLSVQPTKNVGLKIEQVGVGGGAYRFNVSCEFQELGAYI